MDYEKIRLLMEASRTIRGFYGRSQNPCEIFVYGTWYCIEGSMNINEAPDEELLIDGVDVEEIMDVDCFTADSPVESEEELIEQVDDYLEE